MYTIIQLLSGKYHCIGCLQDETCTWNKDTFAAAVESLKEFAKTGNHVKIKKSDIELYKEVQIQRSQYIKVKDL